MVGIPFLIQGFCIKAHHHSSVIKQRMQIHNSAFRSVTTCARTIYRTEGLGAFYVSYPTTLLMTIPFTAVQFSVYDHTLDVINPTRSYDPMSHVMAGGLAGAVAAAVTTPLDVAKTLLQTRGTSHDAEIRGAKGIRDAVQIIWRRDGLKGFARGLTPRVLTFVPSNAICWMSYEFFSKSSG
jgi:solute carrier family 25 (mitochondrial iron transporter), member 28/37